MDTYVEAFSVRLSTAYRVVLRLDERVRGASETAATDSVCFTGDRVVIVS